MKKKMVIIAPTLSVSAAHAKTEGLNKLPSTAAMNRFGSRLRKLRWRIYQHIRFKKRKVDKLLKYYKKLVNEFLEEFSMKLRSKGVAIWKEKVAKTSKNVEDFLCKNRKMKNPKVKTVNSTLHACEKCAMSKPVVDIDAVIVMLFSIFNLVKADQAMTATKMYTSEVSKAPIREQKIGDENITIEISDNALPTEQYVSNEIVTKVDVHATEDETVEKDVVENIVNTLNNEKTSDGCSRIAKDEQFRRSAMAFYNRTEKRSDPRLF